MNFTLFDWAAIVGYLAITLFLGLYFRGRSGKSVDDYFVSGRNVSWWLAGTSMVATTFAADTPLVVTGLVYTQGVAGNWLWWAFLLSGMMTVFLFARLWRRSGLLTDVQFAEMRYSGKPAAFLRGFRALYLGLLMNCLILGWVTKAMNSIVATTLGVSDRNALFICVFFLIPFTGLYVALGGLWGVLWTDLFQFALKMAIVIGVAYYAVHAAGGMTALLGKLAEMRTAAGPGAGDATAFFPDFSRSLTEEALWTIPAITFLVTVGLQWWAFWYPGAEPGGGGYIAQRIFSARDERAGLLSVLWFNIAHYALRPWPWISDRASGDCPLSQAGASRNRIHADRHATCASGPARDRDCRIHGGFHVNSRHAVELGRFVSGLGFLQTIHQACGKRATLRADFACGNGAACDRLRVCFGATGIDSFRLGVRLRSWRGYWRRLSAALVLVADQRVERDIRYGHCTGFVDVLALDGSFCRERPRRVRQDRPYDDGHHDRGLDRGNSAHSARAREYPALVLSQG